MRARGASWKRCGSGNLGAGRVPVRLRAHRDSRPRASLPHLLREGAPSLPTWSVAPGCSLGRSDCWSCSSCRFLQGKNKAFALGDMKKREGEAGAAAHLMASGGRRGKAAVFSCGEVAVQEGESDDVSERQGDIGGICFLFLDLDLEGLLLFVGMGDT
ncbi:uncharacterized protein [Triticum aestivum]|uniref:uncharacterized protein isoform X1 n=1 Tax=Triticum aestivum TaxID=4565 RepID=UPI001D0237F5|nr:uncharacterized protein LOC123086480 isoform X1 [Triticum aestivum]